MKITDPFRKQAASHRGDVPEAKRAGHSVPAVLELFSGHIGQLQKRDGPVVEKPSGLREKDLSGAALEEQTAEFLLQKLHLRA